MRPRFSAHYGPPGLTPDSIDAYVGETLGAALATLEEQIRRTLPFSSDEAIDDEALVARARDIVRSFAARLPEIRGLLVSDLRAAYAGDPAGTGYSEILLVYPGITAIIHHRLAHALHGSASPLAGAHHHRASPTRAPASTSIPAPTIGPSFFIDHGTGVVIGETAIIGDARAALPGGDARRAAAFPPTTTGALSRAMPRHPIVEDDVVIYAGATILGRITIGRGSTIGGNVWLTRSVPPGSHISQAQARSGPPDG